MKTIISQTFDTIDPIAVSLKWVDVSAVQTNLLGADTAELLAKNEPITVAFLWPDGQANLHAADVTQTTVQVESDVLARDDVACTLSGHELVVTCKRRRKQVAPLESMPGTFECCPEGTTVITMTVPRNSSVKLDSGRSDIAITGPWESITGNVGTGDLTCESCTTVALKHGSGDLRFGTVADDASFDGGGGSVYITRVGGDLRTQLGCGSLECHHVGRNAICNSTSGDIGVYEVGGSLTAKSMTGDITTHSVVGKLTAETTSGNVVIGSVGASCVHITTTSGDISISRATAPNSVAASTVSGDIQIGVAPKVPVWTQVSTVSGDLSSTLNPRGEPTEDDHVVEISATSVSGDIDLNEVD